MCFTMKWRDLVCLAVLGLLMTAGVAVGQADREDSDASTGRAMPARTFDPSQVPKALAETEARQRAFYEGMAEKSRYKAALTTLGSALGRYGLNRELPKADQLVVSRYPEGLAATLEAARGPWYNFGKEARLYFLFGSRSKLHPGRMSPEAEKVLLDKMWEWARNVSRREMTSPDRDWWSFGSENHWTHLWTGMWATAHILADHPDYQDRRYADGSIPSEMAQAFDAYAKRWCRNRASAGLLVECNSAYNKQTLSGLYNIADFATDPILKERMRMWLDLYWADWAIEQIDGIRGGSRHRSYPGSHSTVASSAGLLAWYHFGVGEPAQSFHPDVWTAATTTYRPHPLVVEMVLDVHGRGSYASLSRRPGLEDRAVPVGQRKFTTAADHILNTADGDKVNLLDPNGGGLLRYSWCTPDFILGTSMVEARPNNDWWNASSQNRWDGALFGGHSTARIYVQSQSADPKNRSFYNANWSVQSKGVLVVHRLKDGLSENAKGQRVWFDESLEKVEKSGWVFAKAPRAYAAVRVVEGATEWKPDVPFNPAKGDVPGPGMYLSCQQEFSPVIIEVARQAEYPTFSAFQEAVLANPLHWKEGRLDYQSGLYQTRVTLFTDYSNPPQVDGVPVNYRPVKAYDSPFIQGDYGSGVVTLRKGDRQVVLDFTKE